MFTSSTLAGNVHNGVMVTQNHISWYVSKIIEDVCVTGVYP